MEAIIQAAQNLQDEVNKLKEELRKSKLRSCTCCGIILEEHQKGKWVKEWECYCCLECSPTHPDLEAIDQRIEELQELRKTAKSCGKMYVE